MKTTCSQPEKNNKLHKFSQIRLYTYDGLNILQFTKESLQRLVSLLNTWYTSDSDVEHIDCFRDASDEGIMEVVHALDACKQIHDDVRDGKMPTAYVGKYSNSARSHLCNPSTNSILGVLRKSDFLKKKSQLRYLLADENMFSSFGGTEKSDVRVFGEYVYAFMHLRQYRNDVENVTELVRALELYGSTMSYETLEPLIHWYNDEAVHVLEFVKRKELNQALRNAQILVKKSINHEDTKVNTLGCFDSQ